LLFDTSCSLPASQPVRFTLRITIIRCLFLLFAILAVTLSPRTAFAACTSPAGNEGDVLYNTDFKVVQFCNDTSWISMSGTAGTTDARIGTLTASKWCAVNGGGTAIDCTQNAPAASAGADTQVIFNDGGSTLSGDSNFVWNKTTDRLGINVAVPTEAIDVTGKITASAFKAKGVTGAAAPISGSSYSFVAPTEQKFTSGSGTYTTPTSPRSPVYIRVRMVGGGGGGGGSGTAGFGSGGSGGGTTFGSSFLTASGGIGGTANGTYTAGGGASIGAGANGIAIPGGQGSGVPINYGTSAGAAYGGGAGGNSALGGGGGGMGGTNASTGGAGITNSGGGGGGAGYYGITNAFSGSGGGAGGFVDALITSPASSYVYSIGAAGTAGGAGTSGFAGGAGGSGIIVVDEYYQ
jgi:hypothetical protein